MHSARVNWREWGVLLVVVVGLVSYFAYEYSVVAGEAALLAEIETVDDLRLHYAADELTCYQDADGEYLVLLPMNSWTLRSGPPAVLIDENLRKIQFTTELGEGGELDETARRFLEQGRRVPFPAAR